MIDFNGDDDLINVGDIMGQTAYTKSVWIRREGAGTTQNIISNDATPSSTVFWAPSSNCGGSYRLSAGHNASFCIVTGSDIALNTWYHVAVTFDPAVDSGTMILYENGSSVDSATSVATQVDSDVTHLGAYQAFDNVWGGKFTEAAIWNVALTPAEISLLATSRTKRLPLQIQPSSLLGYWPLDDYADGTTLNTDANGYKDLSGNGNHGQGQDADGDSLNVAEEVLTYP